MRESFYNAFSVTTSASVFEGASHGNDQCGLDWARLHGAVAFQRLGPGGQVLQAAADARHAHRLRPAGREPPGVRRQLGLEERLDRLGAAGPLAGDRAGRRGHAELHARPGGQGGHRRRQARAPARSRSPARWPTPAKWPRPPRPPRSRRSSGSTTAAARPWPWPISWSRRASSARSATCGRSICRTGPARRCRCCGGSTRSWPAPAPTAT